MVTPGSTQYDLLRQGYNTRIQKHPRVIALCKNTNGVAEAIGCAAANKLPVAIKSGGHSFEGFSCNDDGLVINLSLLNSIEWMDDTTVKLGPAVTLSHLYDTTLPKRRIIPGGSCGGVGIGGLTLGGGYGFFSRQYGLTCDSLLDITMVDGSGAVHKGSSDPELLWACRGGGNGSLGVVTEMVFKTHPAPQSFHSYRFKAGSLDAKLAASKLERWFELAASLPLSCLSAFVLNGKSLVILVTDFEAPTTELQNLLLKIGAIAKRSSTGKPQNLASALKVYYGRPAPLNFRNCSGGLYKSFDDIRGCITQVLDLVIKHPGLMYQVDTLGGNIANAEFEAASCYPYRDRSFVSELQSYWTAPNQEASLSSSFQSMQKLLQQNGVTAHYVNYPSLEFADWQRDYYGGNYVRLQSVKRKYDPGNVFRYEQSVTLQELPSGQRM
jgi:FAD/FMN-containing dehydrogenase